MKVNTSVQLSEDLLNAIDERARRSHEDRSSIIEAAVRAFMIVPPLPETDREILERRADELNAEAEDVLSYQVIP